MTRVQSTSELEDLSPARRKTSLRSVNAETDLLRCTTFITGMGCIKGPEDFPGHSRELPEGAPGRPAAPTPTGSPLGCPKIKF